MECKHQINKSALEVAKKSLNPLKAKVQCVRCAAPLLLIEAESMAEREQPNDEGPSIKKRTKKAADESDDTSEG